MIQIPSQLKNWRFILLKPKSKEPLEDAWTTDETKQYHYGDSKLAEHLKNGGNYGVLTGIYDGVDHVIIDADTKAIVEVLRAELPRTFEVRTPGGGSHFYYTLDRLEK